MIIFFLCMIVHIFSMEAAPFLAHSKAVSAGNTGDHARAQQLLNQALVASPHDAVLLYDTGVSACKLEQYEEAAAYFEKAAELTEKSQLQEEAWFNAGNAQAHQKKYDAALQQYEKVLAKNPNHERARHNYEQVKKLKEQEEQQQDQQQNDDNKQNQDDKKDQNQKQQKQDNKNSDKSGNDKSNSDQSDQNQDKSDGDQSGDGDGSDQSNDHDDEQESDEERDGDSNSDQKQNNEQQSSKQKKDQQKQSDKKQNESSAEQDGASQEKDREYNKQSEKSGNAHTQPSEKKESHKAQSSASTVAEQAAAPQTQSEIPAELEGADKQWMRCALEACDKQDNKHNKQLLKAVVGNDKGDSRAARSSW